MWRSAGVLAYFKIGKGKILIDILPLLAAMPEADRDQKLANFALQKANSNLHRPRGMGLLRHSIGKNGAIGAITVAANFETFAGSATLETCVDAFGEDSSPIVIRSKGDRAVIHIREDIPTADDPRAIELGIASNRVPELNLDYQLDILADIHLRKVSLEDMFFPDELEALISKEKDSEFLDSLGDVDIEVKPQKFSIVIECDSVDSQSATYDTLTEKGFKCKKSTTKSR